MLGAKPYSPRFDASSAIQLAVVLSLLFAAREPSLPTFLQHMSLLIAVSKLVDFYLEMFYITHKYQSKLDA